MEKIKVWTSLLALFCHFANCMQKEQTKLKKNKIIISGVFLAHNEAEVVKS